MLEELRKRGGEVRLRELGLAFGVALVGRMGAH